MDRAAGVGGDLFEKHRKTRPVEKFRFDVQLPFRCFQFSGYTDVLFPDFSIISGFFPVFSRPSSNLVQSTRPVLYEYNRDRITANNLQSKFLLILYFALRVTIYIISFFLFYVDIIERVESNNCHFLYDDNIPIIISGITDISDVFSKILERITRKEKHLMRLIDLESDLVQSMPNF